MITRSSSLSVDDDVPLLRRSSRSSSSQFSIERQDRRNAHLPDLSNILEDMEGEEQERQKWPRRKTPKEQNIDASSDSDQEGDNQPQGQVRRGRGGGTRGARGGRRGRGGRGAGSARGKRRKNLFDVFNTS